VEKNIELSMGLKVSHTLSLLIYTVAITGVVDTNGNAYGVRTTEHIKIKKGKD
jgi:hypothetical protein